MSSFIKENTRKSLFKWKKILLSCLFNNYYPNYTHTTLHKNKKQNTTLRKPWSEKILNTEQEIIKNKQSTLWLGKTHDTNRLYPWTKIQERLIKQTTLHIRNQIINTKRLKFTTQLTQFKRQWTMNPQYIQNIHYRLLFKTKQNKHMTRQHIQQNNLKHLSKNTAIKEIMNTTYGKHKTTLTYNKNNKWKNNTNSNKKHAIAITEYRKLKLKLNKKKDLKEKLDTTISKLPHHKKEIKNKRGYQKNETLITHTPRYDNFKICNLIIKDNIINKIHIQQHRKMNNLEKLTHKKNIKWP